MICENIGFGTYNCAYNIMLPWLTKDPLSPDSPPKPHTVAIDKCLLPEIIRLWEMGIKTTGCCCGHGKQYMAFIGVVPEHITRMKDMGYKVQFNPCRPDDEDSFRPKTELQYGFADKGFNWWDNYSTILNECEEVSDGTSNET